MYVFIIKFKLIEGMRSEHKVLCLDIVFYFIKKMRPCNVWVMGIEPC